MSRKRDTPEPRVDYKAAVDAHLRARNLTDSWLYDRLGMSGPSYYGIWKRGSLRADVLDAIASALDLTVVQLLTPPGYSEPSGTTLLAEPTPKLYLEQRVEKLEAMMAALQKRKG